MKNYLSLCVLLSLCCGIATSGSNRGSGGDGRNAVEIYDKGNEYFKAKNYKAALAEFDIVLSKYNDTEAYEPALYLAAFSYYKLNKYDQAAQLGEKFIKEFPGSTYYLNAASLIGESNFKIGEDYKAAYYLIKFYTQSTDADARKKAFQHIMDVLPELSLKQMEKLHRVFMSDPIDEHLLFFLAQIEAREGLKAEAERDFNLLSRRFPDTKYTLEVQEYQRFIDLGETSGHVGVLIPISGKWSELGQKLVEIVEYFQKGKILPFNLHYLDTKSDPVDATLATLKMINEMDVDFIICLTSIYNAFGVCGVAAAKGVPVILPMTSEARLENIPLMVTTGQRQDEQARIVARYAIAERGITRFAIIYPDQAKYQSIAEAFALEVSKLHCEVVAMTKFDPDSITLKWQMKAIKEKNPQAIFLAMDETMIINTAPQIAYYGLERIQLLGIESFKDERVVRLGEKYVEDAIFAAPASIDSLTLQDYHDAGFKEDDFGAKLFYTLWKLKDMGMYNRSSLPDMISESLKGRKVSNIYIIKNGDFLKIMELSE
ncbi:ABC transporter substrate-binding protein [candidate division WOR-3 bacterium]|nr:ABC transporter substrate-binding protein [candidate division WOR-3 bacterium]